MKNFTNLKMYKSILMAFVIMLIAYNIKAICPCPPNSVQYPASALTPTASWQVLLSQEGDEFSAYNVTCGYWYDWSYCSGYGGDNGGHDLQLNLTNTGNSPITPDYWVCNDCGLDPSIGWIATFTGVVRIHTRRANLNCNQSQGTYYDLAYKRDNLPSRDLAGSSASMTVSGTTVSLGVNVCNANMGGSTCTSFRVAYYASTNNFISTSDCYLGDDFVSTLGSGNCSWETGVFDLCNFPCVTNGNWYLGYIVDYQNDITESNESNNNGLFSNSTVAIGKSTAPSSASANPNPICSGNSTTLSKSGGSLGTGASWKWRRGSCSGTLVGTGPSISVSPTLTTTYYVRAEGANCGNTSCASVTVTVYQPSVAPTGATANPTPICSGDPSTLTRIGGSLGTNASWEWYRNGCGSTPEGTGTSIVVNPTSTTTYFVRAEGGTPCPNTGCASVTVTVNPTVTPSVSITPASATICSTDDVDFTPTPVNGGTPSYQWYLNGIPDGTGPTYNTGPLTSNATVYCVMTSTANCASPTTATSNTTSITVDPLVGTASEPSGNQNPPVSPPSQTYTTFAPNATSYSWTVPSCLTITSGWGTGTITVNVEPWSCTGSVCVTPSNTCGAGTEVCLTPVIGIEEEPTFLTNLSIYPNPNSGEFTIEMELSQPQQMELELLNVIGQVVYKEGLGKISGAYQKQLDLNGLAKGIYTLQLTSEEGTTTRKIILE